MKLFKLMLLTIALCYASIGSAQNEMVKKSTIVQEINGKPYYLHEVKQGETLSAISREYNVKVADIKENNFGLSEIIQPGDIIKIPVPSIETAGDKESGGRMNYRRVGKGETLYSLSKEYNVPVEEIKAANNGLPEGLKTGAFIKIPGHDRNAGDNSGQQPQEKQQDRYFEFQAREKTSLYEIAIKYRISIDDLIALNPGTDYKLKPGDIIRIPQIKSQSEFIEHTVLKRQTMNRLARKYQIDIKAIKKINPYISRHLQEGQVLRIPLPEIRTEDFTTDTLVSEDDRHLTEEIREKSQKEICHSMYHMGEYDVALLLPFFLSEYDSVKTRMEAENNPAFIKPFVFVQFYEGFLMAVDSLKKLGLNVNIHVFNLEDDISQAKVLIKNPELKSMDLIIGPVYSNTFKVISDFAMKHRINIVNPFSIREEMTWGNPYVFQPRPVFSGQTQKLVEYLNEAHESSQIFIARHNEYRDEAAFIDLKNVLNRDLESRKIPTTSLYHEIIYSRDSIYTFEHLALTDYQNLVIVYSESKVFILDIMRSLNELRDTFNITVIGMPDWTKIEDIEAEHLNNLNTHIFSADYVDYQNEAVRSFIRKFRHKYATEPKEFAYSGYNIGIYFLSALMKFGPAFNDCAKYFDMELLNMGYDFESTGANGFQNKNWKILGMDDYHYKDLSKRLNTYDLSKPPEKYFKDQER